MTPSFLDEIRYRIPKAYFGGIAPLSQDPVPRNHVSSPA